MRPRSPSIARAAPMPATATRTVVGGDLEARTAVQDFERRRPRRVADQRIAEAQADPVERTRNRHAERLIADPAEILHRCVQTRGQHLQCGAHAAIGSLSIR